MIKQELEEEKAHVRRLYAHIETIEEKLSQFEAVNRVRALDMANLFTELSQKNHEIRALKNELFNLQTPEKVKFNTKGIFKLYQFPQPIQGL